MRKYLIILPLVALLAGAAYFAASFWQRIEGPPMPVEGVVAMWLGIVFSLVVGCGLMALVFYSSRQGYDDAVGQATQEPDQPRTR
jgi:hypothetical protein